MVKLYKKSLGESKDMKKYYSERHGLLAKQLQIDFDELLQYFR